VDELTDETLAGFAHALRDLGWVGALLVGGSLAAGDYRPGISDLDLVAVVHGPVTPERRTAIAAEHARVEAGPGAALKLGCTWVEAATLDDVRREHPTWTHGELYDRWLSSLARVDLVRNGYSLFGPAPAELLPPADDEAVRTAVRAELDGYWTAVSRRVLPWRHTWLVDLALVTMSRAEHALRTGDLITKQQAIGQLPSLGVPAWLVDEVRARRAGAAGGSRRRLRGAIIARRVTRRAIGPGFGSPDGR
jgi:hypothetical protein